MKIRTIGDIHGKNNWKDLVSDSKYDLTIFLGDYVDGFNVSNTEIIENLNEIISFKDKNPDKVILLWGNHEGNYAFTPPYVHNPYSCSGYRSTIHSDLHDIFKTNFDKFQLAYQYKNYLWTHAGVHQDWWDYDYPYTKENLQDIADGLNKAFKEYQSSIFQVGRLRGGFKDVGGPLWADRLLTEVNPLRNIHQIVGHSRVNDIKIYNKDETTSIAFCDCLDNKIKTHDLEIL